MDNIEEKLRNLEEWNRERARVKPFIDTAVDCHQRARMEARLKNYEQAAQVYREAIQNYRTAVSQNPRHYLQDLLERIDHVIEEHVNNNFNLRIAGDRIRGDSGIREFVNFIDGMGIEEKGYIDSYDIARAYLRIADFYYEGKKPYKAMEFYGRVMDTHCGRAFIKRAAHFRMGTIFFEQARFKEALLSFTAVLSFDRDDRKVISCIEDSLKKLGISQYRDRFIKATPNEAAKLIMEVL